MPRPAAAAAPAAPSAPGKPAFDVVSVQPTGEAVVAGRAAPGEKVELKDAGKTVAEATANAEGQFVMIPPPLPPGEHSLALSTGAGPSAQTSNAIAVAVAAPEPAPKAAARLRRLPLRRPPPLLRAVLSTALALAPASGAASRVAVQSVEASSGGRLVAKGAAEPNALVRLYLSGAYVGDAKTGADGRWSLTIKHGMTPGAYEMRADEINPADAKVAARAEAPFDYPATAAAAALLPAPRPRRPPAASPADVVVDSIQTHHVERGNTLWGIEPEILWRRLALPDHLRRQFRPDPQPQPDLSGPDVCRPEDRAEAVAPSPLARDLSLPAEARRANVASWKNRPTFARSSA